PLMKNADKVIETHPEKKMLKNGLNIAVPLLAFTLALRYIGPVLSTPISEGINRVHNLFKDNKAKKLEEKETAKFNNKFEKQNINNNQIKFDYEKFKRVN
ncbi:MAG: hypothetical protein ACOCV1_08185, partial [Bacillota bacterium]